MAKKMRRIIYDYYYEQQWIFRIGYARFLQAHSPLPLHTHNNMTEFVYLERGIQKYQTANKNYIVNQGEVFFTRPNELHDTGSSPEERSALYYLIIDLQLAAKLNIFTSPAEYAYCESHFGEQDNCVPCGDTFSEQSDCVPCDVTFSEQSDRVPCGGQFAKWEKRVFQASSALPGALKHLLKCFNMKDQHFDTRVRNALSEVLIAFSTPYCSEKKLPVLNIERSLNYIHGHLEEDISVSDLPALDHLSLSSFNKYFTQALGLPPGEYILKQKIEKTKELLAQTDLSVTVIACRYGFSSSQYFATAFKRFCNMTPTQFRHAVRGNAKGNARDAKDSTSVSTGTA